MISSTNKLNDMWPTLPVRFSIPENFWADVSDYLVAKHIIPVKCFSLFSGGRQLVSCLLRLHVNHRTKTLCALTVYIFPNYFRVTKLKKNKQCLCNCLEVFIEAEGCKNSLLTHFKHCKNQRGQTRPHASKTHRGAEGEKRKRRDGFISKLSRISLSTARIVQDSS